jgi:hypothetical protein
VFLNFPDPSHQKLFLSIGALECRRNNIAGSTSPHNSLGIFFCLGSPSPHNSLGRDLLLLGEFPQNTKINKKRGF